MDKEKKNEFLNMLCWAAVLGWIGNGLGKMFRKPECPAEPEKQIAADRENGCCSIGCGAFLLLAAVIWCLNWSGIAVCTLGLLLLLFGIRVYRRNRTGEHPEIDSAKKTAGTVLLIGAFFLWIGTGNDFTFFPLCGTLGLPLLIAGMIGVWNGWKPQKSPSAKSLEKREPERKKIRWGRYGFLAGAVIWGLVTVGLSVVVWRDAGHKNVVETSVPIAAAGIFCCIFLHLFFQSGSEKDGRKLLPQILIFAVLAAILTALLINVLALFCSR